MKHRLSRITRPPRLGDIIIARSEALDIAGYVVNYNPEFRHVTLSHEQPAKATRLGIRSWSSGLRIGLTNGSRTYDLSHFDSYDVLAPRYHERLKSSQRSSCIADPQSRSPVPSSISASSCLPNGPPTRCPTGSVYSF